MTRNTLRMALCVVMAGCLLVLAGCDSGDLMGQLGAGTQYASAVGMLMRAKGHQGFPTDPISYGLYARDLYDSIARARELTATTASYTAGLSDMGAMVAMSRTKVLALDERELVPPDGRGLREAFGARMEWPPLE